MRALLLLLAVIGAGCTTTADVTVEECEALCARQGRKVSEYRVGSPVPIFRPVPPAICSCS